MFSKVLILFLLLLAFPQTVSASILINEISPSTDTEWIELFNDGATEVDLTGYILEDGNSSHTDDLVLFGTISANGFLVFTHNEGWLNNGGDTVRLYDNASPSAIINEYTYGNIDSSKSAARIPNGSENWEITSNVTNNAINPNPTSSPAPTSQPTNPPTTAPTASPTASPKPTPTKSPTPKPSPSSEATEEATSLVNMQGLTEMTDPTSSPKVAGATTTNKKPIASIIFIGLGVLFLGYSGYLIYNKRHVKTSDIS